MPLPARRLIFVAFCCAAGVGLLALLFYGSDSFNHHDTRLTAHLLAPDGSLRESLSEAAARSANLGPLLVVFAGITLLGLVWWRPWHLAAAGAVALLANVTTQALKVALAHPRLQGAVGVSYPLQIAYPSGHVTAAVSAGFGLWLVAPPRWRPLAVVCGVAYGGVVAAGVVVAGWHFLSDVAGAVLVVAFWACLALSALIWAGLEGRARVSSDARFD